MSRLQSLPSLQRLAFLSPQTQDRVAAYLAHLQARQYAATPVKSTLEALKRCCVLLPPPRHPCLSQDLTATTAADVAGWLLAAHRKGLAPSTINHLLRVMPRFFGFLHERGLIIQPPMHWRRHQVIVPQSLPNPRGDDDLGQWCRVMDRLRDRPRFWLLLRGGLRVGAVSALTWPSSNCTAGSRRIDNSTGQVDRVVYVARDVDNALQQWRHTQPFEATDVFPSPLQPGTPLRVRAIQHLMAKPRHAAGITKPSSPHALRQTCAPHLRNAGAPFAVVKELMGPRSISMTRRYTQLYDATTRDQYDRAMERLEKRQACLEG
jgi:integrase/recombinase XerD